MSNDPLTSRRLTVAVGTTSAEGRVAGDPEIAQTSKARSKFGRRACSWNGYRHRL